MRSAGASDPPSLVAHALEALRGGEYDRAFFVFDRDSHAGFDQALAQIAQSPEGHAGRLEAIVSSPCFEIWVLLHFVMTTKAFVAGGGRSPCEQVIREIPRRLAGYTKGSRGVFDALANKLDTALTHADRLSAHNLETESDNPATAVHALVNYLKSLKPRFKRFLGAPLDGYPPARPLYETRSDAPRAINSTRIPSNSVRDG